VRVLFLSHKIFQFIINSTNKMLNILNHIVLREMLQKIKSIFRSVGNDRIIKKTFITMVVALLVTSIGITIVPIQSASAQSISGPAVSSRGTGRLNVFVIGPDHTLRNNAYFSGSFHGWQQSLGHPPGVNLTSDPTAVSWDANRIDVFVRGSDNKIWWISYDANTDKWSSWSSLPPVDGGTSDQGVPPTLLKRLGLEHGNGTQHNMQLLIVSQQLLLQSRKAHMH
jgi:hypothetical protein